MHDADVGPFPPLDPELVPHAAGLDGSPPATAADIAGLRAGSAARRLTDETLHALGVHVETVTAAGVRLLVARPRATPVRSGVVYVVHGGAMVVGDERGNDLPLLLGPAAELGLTTVSVDYRLAPEHPHPAPVEDCWAGLRHIAAEIARGPVVVAGTSAGGGLAAALTLLARDRGGPRVDGSMLLSPMLDDRATTVSARQGARVGRRDRVVSDLGWRSLLGGPDAALDAPSEAVPARVADLSRVPPTYLDVGSAETFRDEVVDHAARLWASGVDAELHVWPGAFHGFDTAAPDAVISRRARSQRVGWLRRLLG